jgi:DNA invertase Pin-like site-specific DNA recombinase
MLAAISAATNNHAINILPDMSLVAGDTPGAFQPPVAQRDIKAEVIYCVGGVIFHLLGAIDEFQRELIVEGTREGLAAARARGRTGGRKPKLNDRQAATVRRMYAATGPDGKRQHTVAEIAAAVGVHRTTVYDYLRKED